MPKKKIINKKTEHKKDYTVVKHLMNELDHNREVVRKFKALIRVNSVITSSLDKTMVLKNILDQTKILMECRRSSILLVDTEINQLKFAYLTNEDEKENLQNISLDLGEGIAGWVWQHGNPILIKDAKKDERFSSIADKKTEFTTNSLIAVPLVVNGNIIGVMEAVNKIDGTYFTDFEMEVLNYLSIQAAIAIDNAKLYELAITDSLTKLFAKRYFLRRLNDEFKRTKRYNLDMSLIFFDIDNFKNINDKFGHLTGDRALFEVSKIIKNNLRQIDLPCRYGGEEFCLILPETNQNGAIHLAEKIRKKIEAKIYEYMGSSFKLTISGGIASIKENHIGTEEELIDIADKALYFSKENGRNQVSSINGNGILQEKLE